MIEPKQGRGDREPTPGTRKGTNLNPAMAAIGRRILRETFDRSRGAVHDGDGYSAIPKSKKRPLPNEFMGGPIY